MPVEHWDLAVWPSPTSEAELRRRIRARTSSIRRRRVVVMAGSLSLVTALGMISLPRPSIPVQVTTADDARPDDSSGSDPASTTTTMSSVPSVPGMDDVITPGPTWSKPPTAVTVVGLGTVRMTPESTPAPVYGSRHPLLRDPEGDALVEPGSTESNDPTLDLVHLDVTATTATITVELRISDLTREPRPSADGAQQRTQLWRASLLRPEDGVHFTVERVTSDGSISMGAAYARPLTQTDYGGTPSETSIEGVTATVNVRAGIIKVLLPFDAINQAMAENRSPHAPFGVGTDVTPRGMTMVNFYQQSPGLMNYTYKIDEVFASDPGFTYRLGD